MPARRHYARDHRPALIDELEEQLLIKGQRVAAQLTRILATIFKQTLRFSSQFGTLALRDAVIDIEHEVKVGRRALLIKLTGIVRDSTGEPHRVWHILNYGRQPFVQRRTSPLIRARNAMRTKANTLTVERFPGYSGEEFVIPAGTVVDGIEPRNWYPQIADEYRRTLNDFPSIRALNLRMVRFKVTKPDYL